MDDLEQIVADTKKLLKQRLAHESRPVLADHAGVTKHWLEKFDQGAIPNPTIKNLSRLRAYLLGCGQKAA